MRKGPIPSSSFASSFETAAFYSGKEDYLRAKSTTNRVRRSVLAVVQYDRIRLEDSIRNESGESPENLAIPVLCLGSSILYFCDSNYLQVSIWYVLKEGLAQRAGKDFDRGQSIAVLAGYMDYGLCAVK
jgi:hypothetical protein